MKLQDNKVGPLAASNIIRYDGPWQKLISKYYKKEFADHKVNTMIWRSKMETNRTNFSRNVLSYGVDEVLWYSLLGGFIGMELLTSLLYKYFLNSIHEA